jgi:hypothetical protein
LPMAVRHGAGYVERMPDAEELRRRKALGSVRRLAGKTGQDPSTLSGMLAGTRLINTMLLGEIARITRVSLDDLAAPAGTPMTLTGPPPGTCPVSALLDLDGRVVTIRLVCDLDEDAEHPVAHLDPTVMPGGLWWLPGTVWGEAREHRFMLSLFTELPAPGE